MLAAEYQTVLPDEKLLADELDKTRRELEARRIAHVLAMRRAANEGVAQSRPRQIAPAFR